MSARTYAHPRTIIQSGPRNVACIIQAPTLTLPQPHSVRNLCIKIPVNEPTICLRVNKRRTPPSSHTPFPRDPPPTTVDTRCTITISGFNQFFNQDRVTAETKAQTLR